MEDNRKNVRAAKSTATPESNKLGVKHLTLRLPAAPDFKDQDDESAGLTRIRALSELLAGERLTIHALLMRLIEAAADLKTELPVPKVEPVPIVKSAERIDVRVTQAHIHMLDALRDQLKPHPEILDIREYYGRMDVLRELLRKERIRLEDQFEKAMKIKYDK
jgi:hypothetical protein